MEVASIGPHDPDFQQARSITTQKCNLGAVWRNRCFARVLYELLRTATQYGDFPKAWSSLHGSRGRQQQMRAVGKPAGRNSIEALGQLQSPDFAGIDKPKVDTCRVRIGDILAIRRYDGCSYGRLGWVCRD